MVYGVIQGPCSQVRCIDSLIAGRRRALSTGRYSIFSIIFKLGSSSCMQYITSWNCKLQPYLTTSQNVCNSVEIPQLWTEKIRYIRCFDEELYSLLATPASSPRDRFPSDSNYTSIIIETQSFVELNHIRRKSPKAASVLKKRQLSSLQRFRITPAKYQDTDKVPYEEMGTAVVLIGIFFILLVHFLNDLERNQYLQKQWM